MYYQINATETFRERQLALLNEAENRRLARRLHAARHSTQEKVMGRLRRATLLFVAAMAMAVLSSTVALAVNKACPTGTTQQNPCLGTAKTKKASGKDLLIGTNGPDYIKALSGNDQISAGAGNDTTDGGSGNDTYTYKDSWMEDTLIDSSGTDYLNFSAVGQNGSGVVANLLPEHGENYVTGPYGDRADLSTGTVVEKVRGSSSSFDTIFTGGAANTLQPGPGTGGAELVDLGGCTSASTTISCPTSIPASNDTYAGFAASGYGQVMIRDYGGTADTLVFPFASTDVHFQASDYDGDGASDLLAIRTSDTDGVYIHGQLEPRSDQTGHIEQIQFTDTTLSIGSESQPQTLGAATTARAERQVAELNEASTLHPAEKEKLSEEARKVLEEAKKQLQ